MISIVLKFLHIADMWKTFLTKSGRKWKKMERSDYFWTVI